MKLRAVLDANVLYPASLRDLLLSICHADAAFPLWSDAVLIKYGTTNGCEVCWTTVPT